MKTFAALSLLLICSNWQQLQAANILCLVTTPEHNNPSWLQPFFESLAARGHLLKIISTDQTDPAIPGMTHIRVSNDNDVINKYYKDEMGYYYKYWDIKQVLIWYEALLANCRSTLAIDFESIFQSMHIDFDLIIYDATYSLECGLIKMPKYRSVPVMAMSSGKLTTDLMELVQAENTIRPSTVPHFISQLPRDMSYWQRIKNHVMYMAESYIRWRVVAPVLDGIFKNGYTNPDVQVVLLNTHPVLDYVQNIPPNVVEVGGLHIRAESEPLPFGIQEFIERSSEGIIYINLPNIDLMYGVGLKAIENMVREYRQFGFLWNVNNVKDPKLSENFHNLRTINVLHNMQQNILAQSYVKAFVNHGDSFGLQEAVYNAVPVIVLPLLMDQLNNAQRIQERNLGVRINADDFNESSFSAALKQIVRDGKYSNALIQAQLNFRTRPLKPVDLAVWYAEELISQPELLKDLSLPESLEHFYFVNQSLDVLIYPLLFILFIISNLTFVLCRAYQDEKKRQLAKVERSKDKLAKGKEHNVEKEKKEE